MAFNVYDKEGKGEIATSMLGTVMKNLGHNLKPEQLEECIEAVDGDGKSETRSALVWLRDSRSLTLTHGLSLFVGSGTVNFEEFLALMAKKTKEAEDEQELKEAFRVFDKNNRGVIDTSDLKLIFTALDPDMPDEEVEQIIQEVDEDGSGTVDFEGKLSLSFSLILSFPILYRHFNSLTLIFSISEFMKLMTG